MVQLVGTPEADWKPLSLLPITGRRKYAAKAAAGTKTESSLGILATMATQTMPMTRPIALENSPAESAPMTNSSPAAARHGRWRR